MRSWWTAAGLGMGVIMAVAPVSAACTQGDLRGTWFVSGNYTDGGGGVAGHCTLNFNIGGKLVTPSKCTFFDPDVALKVTLNVTGGLLLTSATACTCAGSMLLNGGGRNGQSTSLTAGLSADKLVLAASGPVNIEPTGSVFITALKK